MADVLDSDGRDVREAVTGVALRVRGLVQGVGFRPTVWRLADLHGLSGDVRNDGEGVLIRAWGSPADLAGFEQALIAEPPPLARIDAIERTALEEPAPRRGFVIAESVTGRIATGIVPDAATCPACLAEVLDPGNRRYRYPFTNCTHCGPRLSIVSGIPYDRANTAMAAFPMCPDCRREYEDPADRRFHAEPNACPACGPRVWLEDAEGREIGLEAVGSSLRSTRPTEARIVGQVERSDDPKTTPADAIAAAAEMIRAGCILAIKGIGGFHLACDAGSEAAVAELRRRKRRYHKPFALMARDVAMLRSYAVVNPQEEALLASPAAPIVVLDQVRGGPAFASGLAPGQTCLGFMLPYTPLHHLLLRAFASAAGPGRPAALVMTSGNLSDEPIAYRDADAIERLGSIADAFLLHNREILTRCDDSVVRVVRVGEPAGVPLRRSRGYAPAPIELRLAFPRPVLAVGGHLKNTFCLAKGHQAFVGHHIGDLENLETLASFREGIAHFARLFDIAPAALAYDLHPEYLATKEALAADVPLKIGVQHHHAHIASVLAEHGLDGPAIGVAADGTGYGMDGAIWGCEVLVADLADFTRAGHLAYVPLPGGDAAVRQPWRVAAAYLAQRYGPAFTELDLPFTRALDRGRWAVLAQMIARGVNSPPTSSLGRLFDAVAALVGVRGEALYEGQAAIELETLAEREAAPYPFALAGAAPFQIEVGPALDAIVADVRAGVAAEQIAGRFHATVAEMLAAACARVRSETGIGVVALSGGVFQNRLLLERLAQRLADDGFGVYCNRRVPANDGGLSLGQAAVAAGRMARGLLS